MKSHNYIREIYKKQSKGIHPLYKSVRTYHPQVPQNAQSPKLNHKEKNAWPEYGNQMDLREFASTYEVECLNNIDT